MKKCTTPDCGWKELDEFYSDRTRHDRKCQYCKICFDIRAAERYKKNKGVHKERNKKYRLKVKRETMNAYGGVCQCCGESEIAFLTLDHVNQDGAEHRRKMGSKASGYAFYLWLKKEGWPEDIGLQVLCANCNMARGAYGKCPHEIEREEFKDEERKTMQLRQ